MSRVIVSGAGSLTGFEVIRALASAASGFEVWGTDLRVDIPASEYADRIVVSPPIDSDAYLPFLADLCRLDEVVCYLPILIDEIIQLSSGVDVPDKALVPECRVAGLMKSKRALAEFCNSSGIASPVIFDSDSAFDGPVLVKDARFEQDRDRRRPPQRHASLAEVLAETFSDPGRIVCEYIEGQEYVVHALSNFRGETTTCVVMRRGEMKGGHDVSCETIPLHDDLAVEVDKVHGALSDCSYGPIDMQFIGTTLVDLDFNFPSAMPLFAASGLNSPDLLVRSMVDGKMDAVTPTEHKMHRHPVTRKVKLH